MNLSNKGTALINHAVDRFLINPGGIVDKLVNQVSILSYQQLQQLFNGIFIALFLIWYSFKAKARGEWLLLICFGRADFRFFFEKIRFCRFSGSLITIMTLVFRSETSYPDMSNFTKNEKIDFFPTFFHFVLSILVIMQWING